MTSQINTMSTIDYIVKRCKETKTMPKDRKINYLNKMKHVCNECEMLCKHWNTNSWNIMLGGSCSR